MPKGPPSEVLAALADRGGPIPAEVWGDFWDRLGEQELHPGEALAVLMDEEPTYGYFPHVYYYQGQVREQMKNVGSADSYRAYLGIRGNSTEDPLVPDIRKRTGG